MGSFQNYGPCLGTHYKAAPFEKGSQQGTLIKRTTHVNKTKKESCDRALPHVSGENQIGVCIFTEWQP